MGTREIAVACAAAVLGLGGGIMTAYSAAVPEAYRLWAFSGGLLLVAIGLAMFLWALRNARRDGGGDQHPILPAPPPAPGMIIRGKGNKVSGNYIEGYEVGLDVDGEGHDIGENRTIAPKD